MQNEEPWNPIPKTIRTEKLLSLVDKSIKNQQPNTWISNRFNSTKKKTKNSGPKQNNWSYRATIHGRNESSISIYYTSLDVFPIKLVAKFGERY